MTSNHTRATTLVRALRAAIDRDRNTLEGLFADDVRTWTPTVATASLSELLNELDHRDESFSDIELAVEMTHTGSFTLTDNTRVEPSGIRLALHGVTVAEFLDERTC